MPSLFFPSDWLSRSLFRAGTACADGYLRRARTSGCAARRADLARQVVTTLAVDGSRIGADARADPSAPIDCFAPPSDPTRQHASSRREWLWRSSLRPCVSVPAFAPMSITLAGSKTPVTSAGVLKSPRGTYAPLTLSMNTPLGHGVVLVSPAGAHAAGTA
jgi:hypothetical protein